MIDHMLVRRTRWDDAAATLHEWWELYEYRNTFWGGPKWRPVKAPKYAGNGDSYIDKVSGDREWANKIAQHYGIKVPESVGI